MKHFFCIKQTYFAILTIIIAGIFFTGCKSDSTTSVSKAGTYYGDSLPFGNDTIHSWVKTDINGNPASIGVTFKESALASLAKDSDMMLMMMLPASGGIMSSPFDHIEVDWSPKGDPSPSVYNIPFLDAHFFTVSMAAQAAVKGGPDPSPADMKYIPTGYMLDMDAEAGMGTHCMDTTGKEFHGMAFDQTLMYGFYSGDLYFIEPMVAKSILDTKTNQSVDIKQPQAFKKSGYYPMKYNVTYDAAAKQYSISIDNFMSR